MASPSSRICCKARVMVTTVWKMSRLATRWLYLMTFRFGDHPTTAEKHPPRELVERLALIRRHQNPPAQVDVRDKPRHDLRCTRVHVSQPYPVRTSSNSSTCWIGEDLRTCRRRAWGRDGRGGTSPLGSDWRHTRGKNSLEGLEGREVSIYSPTAGRPQWNSR